MLIMSERQLLFCASIVGDLFGKLAVNFIPKLWVWVVRLQDSVDTIYRLLTTSKRVVAHVPHNSWTIKRVEMLSIKTKHGLHKFWKKFSLRKQFLKALIDTESLRADLRSLRLLGVNGAWKWTESTYHRHRKLWLSVWTSSKLSTNDFYTSCLCTTNIEAITETDLWSTRWPVCWSVVIQTSTVTPVSVSGST